MSGCGRLGFRRLITEAVEQSGSGGFWGPPPKSRSELVYGSRQAGGR